MFYTHISCLNTYFPINQSNYFSMFGDQPQKHKIILRLTKLAVKLIINMSLIQITASEYNILKRK